MGMLIAMPLVLLVVFGYAANFKVENVSTAVVGPQAAVLADRLPSPFDVVEVDSEGDGAAAEDLLRRNKADVAFVTGTAAPVPVLVE